ncbi:CaiB/BaiF CoA transferase family protein [Biostraticola tofi]|uniref:Crotonobetainyl-CoA:carnitine CoA-transferase CaiB-like acyl-CoA transferase n=1 Tax=Biostraticola tofi TaxID=466109 RepID=A0A4V6P446_9GAMM|nr:CoA transferase [Biostraticola tofi]TCV94279.1 crotonobetainyl-CoA:carnitine CoA-transferase CaiB-like acyl-CoA transferase [Biostraticola tofi]
MFPLSGLVVLDFSQFLAGPSAALRLADLGARVIKVERPLTGDASRQLTLRNQRVGEDSLLFHTINRGKESFCANLKDPSDLQRVKNLIAQADVLIENFRPGVMDKIGLGYEALRIQHPRLVYASVTGYGSQGPWADKAGQDLLIQSMSGLAWLNGDRHQPPTPFGLSVADSLAGAHLVEGILACLLRRGKTQQGGRVEISLMESVLSMQFEVLTTWLNDGHQVPNRCAKNNAHAWLAAPYGIYPTEDGHIAIAMGSVTALAAIFQSDELARYTDPATWFSCRDSIKNLIADILLTRPTEHWTRLLDAHEFWCSEVYDWKTLFASEGFKALDITQRVRLPSGQHIRMLRSPLRINGQRSAIAKSAPRLGEDTASITADFNLAGVDL